MSRPKTKGDMIGVRLPLEVDAHLRAQAERLGMSPGALAAELLTKRAYEPLTAATPIVERTDAEVTVVNQDDPAVQAALENRFLTEGSLGFDELYGPCSHPKARIISGGLKHCDDCNATTNIRGEWP